MIGFRAEAIVVPTVLKCAFAAIVVCGMRRYANTSKLNSVGQLQREVVHHQVNNLKDADRAAAQ